LNYSASLFSSISTGPKVTERYFEANWSNFSKSASLYNKSLSSFVVP